MNEGKQNPVKIDDIKNLHPSWQAKKAEKEKLKNLAFKGTKIKFDE